MVPPVTVAPLMVPPVISPDVNVGVVNVPPTINTSRNVALPSPASIVIVAFPPLSLSNKPASSMMRRSFAVRNVPPLMTLP